MMVQGTRPAGGRFALGEGALWLDRVSGATAHLRVESGRLWVTLERSPRDFLLQAGDEIDLADGGLVVAEAVSPAEFEVVS